MLKEIITVIGLDILVANTIYKNPKITYVDKLPIPFEANAVMIPMDGIYIKKSQKGNDVLLRHELVHWQQYQRMGFFLFTMINSIYHHTLGYDHNPFEIEARYEESDYCKTNAIECVRTGKSVTAYNPNFLKKI